MPGKFIHHKHCTASTLINGLDLVPCEIVFVHAYSAVSSRDWSIRQGGVDFEFVGVVIADSLAVRGVAADVVGCTSGRISVGGLEMNLLSRAKWLSCESQSCGPVNEGLERGRGGDRVV